MSLQHALSLADLPSNSRKTVTLPAPDGSQTKILLVRTEDSQSGEATIFAVEAECPHAKAPLEKGAVCNGRLICPFHTGTFELATGAVIEPPPLRDLRRYAFEIQGENIMVDPTPMEEVKHKSGDSLKELVFAGAGAATSAAIAYLRDAGFGGRITVIDPVDDEPVDRTQLTKNALGGQKPLDTLPLFQPRGKESFGALHAQFVGERVARIDTGQHQVTFDDGAILGYDALLLATGGVPKTLQVPGANLPHVFTIRHTADLKRMESYLGEGKRAVCIGDSFIAFEAASALRQRGLHVTVVANSEVPFVKKFGEDVAHGLLNLHRSKGVTIHTEVEVSAITPVAVELEGGAEIPADLVITAIGVEPAIEYAPDLPRGERGGFAVDRDLRLAPNVWAAGDIASVDGTRIEHWRLAQQHGRTAAEAMYAYVTDDAHGPATPFKGVPLFWTTHFGKRLNYAGHADKWDRIAIEGDPAAMNFLAYYVKDEKVAAVLGCGKDTAIAALMEPLREPLTLERAQGIVQAAA